MQFCYVMIDCNKIQDYVFASTKLRGICNASLLLDHIETVRVPETAKKHGGHMVRSGGGIAIARFNDPDKAVEFQRMAAELYRENGLSITCHDKTVDSVSNFYKDVLAPLLYKINAKKQCPEGVFFNVSSILAVPCKYSGKGYAGCVVTGADGKTGIPISHGEARKFLFEKGIHPIEQELLNEFEGFDLPADLGGVVSWRKTLGPQEKPPGTSEERILGIIYADVNGLGNLTRPIAQEEGRYSEFCKGLRKSLSDSLKESIVKVIGGEIKKDKRKFLPLKILYVGGDDLAVAVKGCYAMDIAVHLLKEFEVKSASFIKNMNINDLPEFLTLSAGLVLAPCNYPVRSFNLLGNELENKAKYRGRNLQNEKKSPAPPSLIDFCFVKNSSQGGLQEIRRYKRIGDRLLYGGPYSPDELGSFRKAAQIIREKRFPSNKIRALSGILMLDKDNAEYQYLIWRNSLEKENQDTFRDVCRLLVPELAPGVLPFEERYEKESTRIIDLIELIGLYGLTF